MEYLYSRVVDPSTYETEGLCDGLPLRVHNFPDREDIGTLRAQEDWRKYVGPLESYRGGLGPEYSFMAVSVPECLPERLEIISYANEFAFLHDDVTDTVSQEQGDMENDHLLEGFEEAVSTGNIKPQKSGKRQIQAKILLEMLTLDRPRARTTMKAWSTFVELASGRRHHTHFATLDEYLPYRIIDVGQMFWFGMVTFGMAITIPEKESKICAELSKSACIAAGLTNDLFSWDKEYDAATRNGDADVPNAIWVMMGEHSITAEEAKLLCRKHIKVAIADYIQVVKDSKDNEQLSLDLRKYLEALQYSLSGNVVWSLRCPRYHPERNYNALQLARMRDGVECYPTGILTPDTTSTKSGLGSELTSEANNFPTLKRPGSPMFDDRSRLNKEYQKLPDKAQIHQSDTAILSKVDNSRTSGLLKTDWQSAEVEALLVDQNIPQLSDEVIVAPYRYLTSFPSKGVRDQVIDALNLWIEAPQNSVEIIKTVIKRLHHASLMLDDIEDMSHQRRGNPATHIIFGTSQTINSATFQYIQALVDVRRLDNAKCLDVFTDEMQNLYYGQGYDLYWTHNMTCPTLAEYLKMVDNKTGGLFRLAAGLMTTCSPHQCHDDINNLVILFGRLFQIWDDYQNLTSADYMDLKGFCQDLDEGKYSLPLIHTIQNSQEPMQLQGSLMQRRIAGHATMAQKQFVLEHMKRTKSLEFTARVMDTIQKELFRVIHRLERRTKVENFPIRLVLDMLDISS